MTQRHVGSMALSVDGILMQNTVTSIVHCRRVRLGITTSVPVTGANQQL